MSAVASAKKILAAPEHEFGDGGSASFSPPAPPTAFAFTLDELAAAIARANALKPAPIEVIHAMNTGALAMLEALAASDQTAFRLTDDLLSLGDSRRTDFSADVGAGVTHLYMMELGYVFSCNGRQLIPRGRVPDLLYVGAHTKDGRYVAAEAKGSFSQRATSSRLKTIVRDGFARQVRPYLDGGIHFPSPLIHGYCIGVAGRPTSDAFMAVVEAGRGMQHPGGSPPPDTAKARPPDYCSMPGPMAAGNGRAAFALMGAPRAVASVDAASRRSTPLRFSPDEEFDRTMWNGRETFVAKNAFAGPTLSSGCGSPRPTFGLDVEIGEAYLQALS